MIIIQQTIPQNKQEQTWNKYIKLLLFVFL